MNGVNYVGILKYSNALSPLVLKAKIVAKLCGLDLTQQNSQSKDKKDVLEIENGMPIDQGNAIARYLSMQGGSLLYPSPPFCGNKREFASNIDAWIDYSADVGRKVTDVIKATTKQDQQTGIGKLMSSLETMEQWLSERTFLCGNELSLADVVMTCDLYPAFTSILEGQYRQNIPHVQRWFLTCTSQPGIRDIIQEPKICERIQEPQSSSSKKSQKSSKPAADKKQNKPQQAQQGGKDKKKETRLGLESSKFEDFGEWYTEVVTEAELISYYNVSGCYILRPYAFAMWEKVQTWFDTKIKQLGVQNAYFPLFVTKDVLETEKDHVEGFSAEVAWVTKSGGSDMEVPIAIRPTSETVMYPYYAQWIRSHRDLPLRLNQWTNVVRWEFKHPTPFIRSREFLWQEGHTAFATKEEADKEVLDILDLYARVYEELMAVPVMRGIKSKGEQFAGALYTTTVEGFIPATGKGIQGATSHCLGQNFSKMFQIEYEAEDKSKKLVWQNSWGITTRTIGVMVMTHGDNKGLVNPPRMAPTQVIVIPIPKAGMSPQDKKAMFDQTKTILSQLSQVKWCDEALRLQSDERENYTPGWKYNHWELKGVPIRMELGPKDMQNQTVVMVRRDTGTKEFVSWSDLDIKVPELLEKIQNDMYSKARAEFDSCVEQVTTWDDFMNALDNKHMALAPWADEEEIEDDVRKRSTTPEAMGAKTLCIPFQQPELPSGTVCFASGKPAKNWALFGRSY
eukprot:TRINITY_DN9135_c0_g1_i2.p1 TRINITY_DN9135_c0_g1~~TRINITY_DN9135_c0_g1_i2.p1  ORF type:complete len:737 (+),score=106.99 TRINITY_DN9135_c0_g1_i2:128-2338(+)